MLHDRLFRLESDLGTAGPPSFVIRRTYAHTGRWGHRALVGLLSEEHDLIGASRTGSGVSVDISDKQSILAMYKQVGDAVVCVGGTAKFAPLDALTDDDFAFSLANKLMGQANLVRYGVPYISQGGSVTLTSGVLAQHPMLGSAAVSTVNAGIEAFGRAAALELQGKIRVNVVGPGWVWETLEAIGRVHYADSKSEHSRYLSQFIDCPPSSSKTYSWTGSSPILVPRRCCPRYCSVRASAPACARKSMSRRRFFNST